MSVLSNTGILAGASGAVGGGGDPYNLERSTRFNSDDSAYSNRTPTSAGNRKTWTWSGWVKRSNLSGSYPTLFCAGSAGASEGSIRFKSDNTIEFYDYNSGYNARIITTAAFRDPSAWYHIVAVFDTINATADQRIRIYINGVEDTGSQRTNPSQNHDGFVNNNIAHSIGSFYSTGRHFDGLIADVNFVDGLALDPTSFAEEDEDTGQWVPKEYTHSTSAWHTVNDGTTWSDSASNTNLIYSGSITNVFNGVSTWSSANYASFSVGTLTLFSGASITASNTIRIYGNWTSNDKIEINGTEYACDADGSHKWISPTGVTYPLTLNSLAIDTTPGNIQNSLSAVEIDGHILVDDAVDNSFHLAMDPAETGTTYSDGVVTGTSDSGNYGPWSNVFDGNTATSFRAENTTGGETSLTFTTPIPFTSTLEIAGYQNGAGMFLTGGNDIEVDVTSQLPAPASAGITQITGVISPLKKIRMTSQSANNNAVIYGGGIYVDGKELLNHTAIGYDSSGNENHWHENNLVASETLTPCVEFDGTGDYLDLGTSSDYAFGTGDFTIEMYVFRPNDGRASHNTLFATRGGAGTTSGFNIGIFEDSSSRRLYLYSNGQQLTWTNGVPEGWVHIAITRSGTSLKSFINGVNDGTGTNSQNYTNDSATIGAGLAGAYEHTLGFISDFRIIKGTALYTSNFTPPTTPLTNVTNTKLLCCQSNTSAGAAAVSPHISGINDGTVWSRFLSSPDDSDGSESYKLFDGNISNLYSPGGNTITFDITSIGGITVSTSLEVYFSSNVSARDYTVNGGSAVNSGTGTTWVDLGFTGNFNTLTGTNGGQIGAIRIDGSTILIDPVTAIGDAAATDQRSNGENLDLLADTPGAPYDNELNGGGNYATWNPLDTAASGTLANGNLDFSSAGTSEFRNTRSTFAVSSGKWYFEGTLEAIGGAAYIGLGTSAASLTVNIGGTNTWGYVNSGNKQSNSTAEVAYGASYTTGDVIGVAFDADNGTLTFYKNDSTQGQAYSGLTSGPYFFMVTGYNGTTWNANFGQRTFDNLPTDYKALNTFNLDNPLIDDPSEHFDVVLYDGDDSTDRDVDAGLPLDMVWIKNRGIANDHILADAVRGNYHLYTNGVWTEGSGRFGGFSGNTFNLSDNDDTVNKDNDSYVAWAWNAGDAANTTAVSVGSLNSVALNKDQTWSSGMKTADTATTTYSASGRTTTMGYGSNTDPFDADQTNFIYGKTGIAGTWIYLEFSSALSNVTSISFSTEYSCPSSIIKLNGTDVAVDQTADGGFREVTVTGTIPASLTEIAIQGNGGSSRLKWVKIDGKLLIDSGVTYNLPSIASEYKANTTAGFSIVTYGNTSDGDTIGHSLSASPHLIITKNRDSSSDWNVYFDGFGASDVINLNNTDAKSTSGSNTFIKAVSSTTFTVGSSALVSGSDDYIAYCWAPVEGFSKFGSYEGNGDPDGPFVWCGFRPALVIIKNADQDNSWFMMDKDRSSYNPLGEILNADANTAETSTDWIDFTSNGFKIRATSTGNNNSAKTQIFAAWAESPFKYSNAR